MIVQELGLYLQWSSFSFTVMLTDSGTYLKFKRFEMAYMIIQFVLSMIMNVLYFIKDFIVQFTIIRVWIRFVLLCVNYLNTVLLIQ